LTIQPFVPNEIIDFCLTDASKSCSITDNVEMTFEALKIQTISIGFLVENKGNIDVLIALELTRPDGTTGIEKYLDENLEEWRLAIAPADTTNNPRKIHVGESMDWGEVTIIANKVLPGSYTFTLDLMRVTVTGSGAYTFESLEQVTITILVEGDVPVDETPAGNQEDGTTGTLPAPSVIVSMATMAFVALRRRY